MSTIEALIDAAVPAELEKYESPQYEQVKEPANAPDYVQPYKYRACEHGVWIPEWPRLYVAVRCPECFPEGPANCDPADYGDYVAFGFVPQILKAVRKRGFIQIQGNTGDVAYGALEAVAQSTGYFIRHDAREDLINECRVHMLRKRQILTKRAEVLGWTTAPMKAYVRSLCENLIKDLQLKKSDHHIERGEDSFASEYLEDSDEGERPQHILDVACDLRGKRVCVTQGEISDWLDPETSWLDILLLLDKLPADLRRAFEAKFPIEPPRIRTNTWAEAAEILGVDVSKARRRVAAAIRMMIEQVES